MLPCIFRVLCFVKVASPLEIVRVSCVARESFGAFNDQCFVPIQAFCKEAANEDFWPETAENFFLYAASTENTSAEETICKIDLKRRERQ